MIDRATLNASTGKITWNGGTFFSKNEISARHDPEWKDVLTDAHGQVDKAAIDLIIKQTLTLWGAWENLPVLFPSSVLTPTIGSDIYGTSDLPLVIQARNNDRITYHNTQLTKLSNLFLGVNDESFSADLEFTTLIKNNANPEDANSYFTADTNAWADTTFAKTNYKQQRQSAAWGAIGGFNAFQAQKGWTIDWELGLEPRKVDAVGTVGMKIQNFLGRARCIPLGPTIAQLASASQVQGVSGLGRLLSTNGADLVITGVSAQTVTLKNAGMLRSGLMFGSKSERQGETEWCTTVGFAAGTAAARAVIA